jgi:UDP-glucose 4-epimerase
MDRVLVTGAAGKIGANVVKALLDKGYGVRALVMPGDPKVEKLAVYTVEIVEGDVREPAILQQAVDGIDGLVHLASIGHFARDDVEFFETDVNGTYHLLRACVHAKPRVRKVVFASSMTVYGMSLLKVLPVDEEHPLQPDSTLSLVKNVGEQICWAFLNQYGLATTALRFTVVYAGVDVLRGFDIPSVLKLLDASQKGDAEGRERARQRLSQALAADDKQLVALTDESGRPWTLHPVDIRDVAHGVVHALGSDAGVGQAFNLAAPSAVTRSEGACYLANALGVPYLQVPLPWHTALEVSVTKTRTVLGYQPRYTFYDMVDAWLAMRRGEDVGIVLDV